MPNNNFFEEIWKDVDGYDGTYKVSNMGRVKSVRYIDSAESVKEKILSSPNNQNGYPSVSLCKYGRIKTFVVHRLVALAFVPNPLNKPHVNHKDGDKMNPKAQNLEWCTPYENNLHAFKNGLLTNNNRSKKVLNGEVFIKDGNHVKCRKIIQKDLYGKHIKVWNSLKEASFNSGIKYSDLTKACQLNISAGNFLWEYESRMVLHKKYDRFRVIQKNLDGNVVKVWDNISKIKEEMKYHIKYILSACKGRVSTAYDFLWEFEEIKEAQNPSGFEIIGFEIE